MEGRKLRLDCEEDALDSVDPWFGAEPDAMRQTGGDWYRLFLTTALGGRAVHGANTSPTCEVICKARKEQLSEEGYGVLKWDDSVKAPNALGNDISDRFYVHSPYRGTITASGSILAYESGLWEPSMRKRVRSSALLAAGLVVHGKSNAEACRLVGKLMGEPIDIQAVDGAILPASHLKREMVLISKANHRVFGKGSIQCGLTWFDDKLVAKVSSPNMALDWGRITTIARYIGEANIQNCHAFTYHARLNGIPFVVVRNSWAYVAETDYHLPSYIFDNVPSIDLSKYGIPSMIGTFIGHEQDVMLALNRGTRSLATAPENEAFRAYLKLHKEARDRRRKRKRADVPSESDFREVLIREHTLTPGELSKMVEGGVILREAFIQAIASLRQADPGLHSLLLRISDFALTDDESMGMIDRASRILYDKNTWILARVIAERTMLEKETGEAIDRGLLLDRITSKLASMKSDMIGYKAHIETDFYASTSVLLRLRAQTISLARRSGDQARVVTFSQRDLASNQLRLTAQALDRISDQGSTNIQCLVNEVAPMFEGWYTKIAEDEEEDVRVNLAYFAYLYAFLHDLRPLICYQKTSGYIEGTLPRRSYVYQGMLRTASDYHFVPPKLQRPAYLDAHQLALELDTSGAIPYSVVDAVAKVESIADLVVGELMEGRVWRPSPTMYLDLHMQYAKPLSPGYDDSMLKEVEDEDQLSSILNAFHEQCEAMFKTGFEACLNSYASKEFADKVARANGYPDIRAAFDMVGTEAYYSETSQFVIKARALIEINKKREEAHQPIARTTDGYSAII